MVRRKGLPSQHDPVYEDGWPDRVSIASAMCLSTAAPVPISHCSNDLVIRPGDDAPPIERVSDGISDLEWTTRLLSRLLALLHVVLAFSPDQHGDSRSQYIEPVSTQTTI